ncbi:MAG: cytochrome c biogenesis protein ResB [Bacteroidales bacterium]|nr:cytochrome c biogenesis protein ResB [Bacteroidales bacterium]
MNNNKKIIWQYPWGYGESFIIVITLMILGFATRYIRKSTVSTIQLPANLYFGVAIVIILLLVYFLFKKKPFVKWLSSLPAAISAICFYSFLVLLMGFIPQGSPKASGFIHDIGLSDLVSSQTFLFAQIYFLVIIGMVTLRRSFPLKGKNIAFFLNHFGLWLTLFAASIGAGDLQRVTLTANKTDAVYYGINQKGKTIHDLGIAIQLNEFLIDEYSPKAFIIDDKSGDILNKKLFYLEKGNKGKILDWEIEVTEFYKYGVKMGTEYHPVYDIGAAPAAYVIIRNKKTVIEGWISCGSFRFQGNFLKLSDGMLLVMAEPEPKKYSSEVKIYTDSGNVFETTIKVNKPVTVNGWKIYQLDYDHDKGKWSDISVLELVKDPWLPVVYFGIFMLISGALYMFWIGNKKKIS